MKKAIIVLICICVALCFSGCSPKDNGDTTTIETKYYEYAQECIEKGDTETAIKALEEGVEKTGSEKLKELLNTLTEENKENESEDQSEPQTSDEDTTSSEVYSEPSSDNSSVNSVPSTPKITYLGKTIWSNTDPYGRITYLFFFGGGEVAEYCDAGYNTIGEYRYTFDGNILSLNGGQDIYYFKILSIANNNHFGSTSDKILLEGQGFLSGEWEFAGWV